MLSGENALDFSLPPRLAAYLDEIDGFIEREIKPLERENIKFVVIDSLNMLDPTKNRTADNLSALKEKEISTV